MRGGESLGVRMLVGGLKGGRALDLVGGEDLLEGYWVWALLLVPVGY